MFLQTAPAAVVEDVGGAGIESHTGLQVLKKPVKIQYGGDPP